MGCNGAGEGGPVKGNYKKQTGSPLSPVVFLSHHSGQQTDHNNNNKIWLIFSWISSLTWVITCSSGWEGKRRERNEASTV